MKKSQHRRSGAYRQGSTENLRVPLLVFTPDELSLFDDAINLLRVVASAQSEAMPTVSEILSFAIRTQQKLADMQKHMGEMFIFQNNDYVVLNTALLVFIQVIRLMPQLLSDELDKPLTETRLVALGKKLSLALRESFPCSDMQIKSTLHD